MYVPQEITLVSLGDWSLIRDDSPEDEDEEPEEVEEDSVLCSLLDSDDELPVLELLEEEEDELLELDGLPVPRLGDSGFFSTGVTLSVLLLSSSACAWFSRSCALLRIFSSATS